MRSATKHPALKLKLTTFGATTVFVFGAVLAIAGLVDGLFSSGISTSNRTGTASRTPPVDPGAGSLVTAGARRKVSSLAVLVGVEGFVELLPTPRIADQLSHAAQRRRKLDCFGTATDPVRLHCATPPAGRVTGGRNVLPGVWEVWESIGSGRSWQLWVSDNILLAREPDLAAGQKAAVPSRGGRDAFGWPLLQGVCPAVAGSINALTRVASRRSSSRWVVLS